MDKLEEHIRDTVEESWLVLGIENLKAILIRSERINGERDPLKLTIYHWEDIGEIADGHLYEFLVRRDSGDKEVFYQVVLKKDGTMQVTNEY